MLTAHTRLRSWAGVALLGLTSVSVALADVPISANANRRFKEGVRYLKTKEADRYERAYREFKAAYSDSPSWKILGNLGIVAQELERDGEAIDAFRGYLKGGGKELSADERKQFQDDLELLESGHATVTLTTAPDGAWIVDEHVPETGASVVNRYGPTSGPLELRIRGGHHVIRAELSGYTADPWENDQRAGSTSSYDFRLQRIGAPADKPERREETAPTEPFVDRPRQVEDHGTLRALSFVALGLGVVGAGAGTYFYLDSKKASDRADEAYELCAMMLMAPQCAESDTQVYRDAKEANDAEGSARTRSLVSFVAAGALLTTGVTLFLLSSEGEETQAASISPWLGPQSIGVSGRF
jgi:hypothetical protein